METGDTKFKKATQEVNKSNVTDHNIHDDYLKDPPMNVTSSGGSNPGQKEGAYEVEEPEIGVLGQEGMGRPKKQHIDKELVDEGTVNPNNPPS